MTINQHVTSFADLPVVNFDPAAAPTPDWPDPASVAWRVGAWEEDEHWDSPVSPAFAAAFEAFLATPSAHAATALVIGSWGYAAMNSVPMRLLCDSAPRLPALRALFLGDITFEECEISWIKQGDITPLLRAFPHLEVLRVRGTENLELSPVYHGSLRELALESGGLPAPIVRAVAECDLPKLRQLELWLGTDNYGGDASVEDLAPILTGTRLPALTHLGLRDAEIADLLAPALAAAPVVARLESMDLSLGMLSDVGMTALLAGQPLTHLRKLDLHHHYLSEEMMARVRDDLGGAGVEVDLSDANGADTDITDRYVAVSE